MILGRTTSGRRFLRFSIPLELPLLKVDYQRRSRPRSLYTGWLTGILGCRLGSPYDIQKVLRVNRCFERPSGTGSKNICTVACPPEEPCSRGSGFLNRDRRRLSLPSRPCWLQAAVRIDSQGAPSPPHQLPN